MMDTFRFLLTDSDIKRHFECVRRSIRTGGIYITDMWVRQLKGSCLI